MSSVSARIKEKQDINAKKEICLHWHGVRPFIDNIHENAGRILLLSLFVHENQLINR